MSRRFSSSEPMGKDELRPADEAILGVLSEGRGTKGYLIDETDKSRTTIYEHLEILEEAGHVETIHEPTRLVELVDDPRD